MRISEIEVDRFRIWRNLSLALDPSGINVVCGPNEAGKTTLMQFVRSILYGFSSFPDETGLNGREEVSAPWQGSLRVVHKGRRLRIRRRSDDGNGSQLSVTGLKKRVAPQRVLAKLLGGTDERVFDDVFAIGLSELQQLATLDNQQVAERIYGLSLGPQGRGLLDAMSDVDQRREHLVNEDGGRLAELFARYQKLPDVHAHPGAEREQHAELCLKRSELDSRIADLEHRQTNIRSELRGHRYLQRCQPPWKRARELQVELNGMPLVNELPANVFEELDGLESEIETAVRSRDRVTAEADQLRRQIDRVQINTKLESNEAAVLSVVEQAGWLNEIDERINATRERLGGLRHELQQATQQLGDEWTPERLESVDAGPAAQARLMQAARGYQAALTRRARLRGLYRRCSKATRQQMLEHDEQMAALENQTIQEALEEEQQRLFRLQSLSRLRLRERELEQRRSMVDRLLQRVDAENVLPRWVDVSMAMIGFAGVALFVIGMLVWAANASMSSAHAALAGAAFGLAGIMWFTFRIGLRTHLDRQVNQRRHELHEESETAAEQLESVRNEIAGLAELQTPSGVPQVTASPAQDELREIDAIHDSLGRITELERLAETDEHIRSRRRRLSELRNRFRTARQQLDQDRQDWCGTLVEIGLQETIRVDDVFHEWQRVLDANGIRHRLHTAAPELEGLRRTFDSMQRQIEELGQRIGDTVRNDARPLEVLAAWKEQLDVLNRDRLERDRLQREESEKQTEAAGFQARMDELATQQSTLLSRAGATTREELVQRSEWIELRRELESDLATVREELQEVAESEPDIALVEDDLIAWERDETETSIATLEQENEALKRDLSKAHEDLGGLRNRISELESGRSSMGARFERSRVAGDIHRAVEEWCSLQIAESVVDEMRREFERTTVSETLALASEQLENLTQGRYRRIWAPLGKHRLSVDDQYNRTLRVEDLSGGTREQMFLAIRLALVRGFADRGIELPMVLDDVLVNFDQTRTQAAVDSLLRFAAQGRQVLFLTCHTHLAGLFELRGVRPVWLPGHRSLEEPSPETVTAPSSAAADVIETHEPTLTIDHRRAG